MELFWHELVHISISLIVGLLVWKVHKNLKIALIAAILGGVFIDLDHLFDYFLVYGFDFNLRNFLAGTHFAISNRVYVPFHGWEYLILLSLLYLKLEKNLLKQARLKKSKLLIKKQILTFTLALTLGAYSHLIIDTITNNVALLGYSITYRLIHDFNIDKITK